MVLTRRSQSDKKRDYQVGDHVEVLRTDGVSHGTLLCKTETITTKSQPHYVPSPTSNSNNHGHELVSHWMVAVDGKEEDVSERMLGRVLDGRTSAIATASETSSSDSSTMAAAAAIVSASPSPSSRDASLNKKTTTKKKKQKQHPPVVRKTVAAKNKHIKPNHHANTGTRRAVTRSAGPSVELLSGIDEIVLPPKPPKPTSNKKASSSDNNVIKVKMLTGTLYMYRNGPHRSVKFVRTK